MSKRKRLNFGFKNYTKRLNLLSGIFRRREGAEVDSSVLAELFSSITEKMAVPDENKLFSLLTGVAGFTLDNSNIPFVVKRIAGALPVTKVCELMTYIPEYCSPGPCLLRARSAWISLSKRGKKILRINFDCVIGPYAADSVQLTTGHGFLYAIAPVIGFGKRYKNRITRPEELEGLYLLAKVSTTGDMDNKYTIDAVQSSASYLKHNKALIKQRRLPCILKKYKHNCVACPHGSDTCKYGIGKTKSAVSPSKQMELHSLKEYQKG